MGVLNFLEWFELHYGVNGVGTTIEAVQTITMKMQMVSNFYSQPFKPEMITELFAGWVKENYKEGKTVGRRPKKYFTYEINNGEINQWNEFVGYRLDWTEYSDGVIFYHISYHSGKDTPDDRCNKKPPTLDTFISDCQRAGIELTWKPEIINKYF